MAETRVSRAALMRAFANQVPRGQECGLVSCGKRAVTTGTVERWHWSHIGDTGHFVETRQDVRLCGEHAFKGTEAYGTFRVASVTGATDLEGSGDMHLAW